jgi:hypothetical protein
VIQDLDIGYLKITVDNNADLILDKHKNKEYVLNAIIYAQTVSINKITVYNASLAEMKHHFYLIIHALEIVLKELIQIKVVVHVNNVIKTAQYAEILQKIVLHAFKIIPGINL